MATRDYTEEKFSSDLDSLIEKCIRSKKIGNAKYCEVLWQKFLSNYFALFNEGFDVNSFVDTITTDAMLKYQEIKSLEKDGS